MKYLLNTDINKGMEPIVVVVVGRVNTPHRPTLNPWNVLTQSRGLGVQGGAKEES